MKIIGLLSLILLLHLSSYAQACDNKITERDSFTNRFVSYTHGTMFMKMVGSAYFRFIKTDSVYSIIITYYDNSETALSVGLNDKLILKLDNGNVLVLPPLEVANGVIVTVKENVRNTLVKVRYAATMEQLKILSQYSVQSLRVSFTSENRDNEIPVRHQNEIKMAAICLLQ